VSGISDALRAGAGDIGPPIFDSKEFIVMGQPVWTLSVDLQTKTATFTSGLSDAAKSARGSFNDIKAGAKEMGAETSYSMSEARHGVMLLGEEFGVHLPRALTSFLASLGPIGAAMEAAFPFLAIAVGATLLLEHLAKLREEGDKLTESQKQFGTTVANVLNGLDEKLLQAGIRADELNHNHLAALNKQLELIDRQSMNELVRAFDTVAKAADSTFAQLKTNWFSIDAGSTGAKAALEHFKTEYASLLAQGKEEEAHGLLTGTLKQAKEFLEADLGHRGTEAAPKKEIESQEQLVKALEAQVQVEQKLADLKQAQKQDVTQKAHNDMGADADKLIRAQAEAEKRGAEEKQKLWEENYKSAVEALQTNEREKIDATQQGSLRRLAAIDAAMKEEESKGLQETGFYRSLLTDRVKVTEQMTEEEKKLKAEGDKESAEHDAKMKELALADDRTTSTLRLSAMMNSQRARLAEEIRFADEDQKIKLDANAKEIAALDKSAKDYENKLKALQDRQKELIQQHENTVTQIKVKAEEERNTRILSGERRMDDDISRSLTNMLMRHQSFASMMGGLTDQVASGMIQTAIKSILADDMTKEHDAAAAARKAYLAGMQFPFPANVVIAPAMAAMAFASVMAFEGGGLVPGVGRGDVVPAMLTPGEAVIPKKLTEGLTNAAEHGGLDRGPDVHVHHTPTYHIHAIDADGVNQMLREHGEKFTQHATNTLRKMNR
jgi:hypothetical protein